MQLGSDFGRDLLRLLELSQDHDLQVEIIRPARGRWQVVLWRDPVVADGVAGSFPSALRSALERYESSLQRRKNGTKMRAV